MKVGVPKEIKPNEHRVGLTPDAVREYVAHGHSVLVESSAGSGIGASNGGREIFRSISCSYQISGRHGRCLSNTKTGLFSARHF